ncbi:MAG TPA: 6-phosphogluconolactonase [Terriglobales bacterium]|jgi:6-phosphogluconolactonase|nr:6-phosphogluconolactonase [Terriglobales bacterium]
MSAAHDIRIFDDPQRLFQGAAEEFASQATAAVRSRGRFTVALSGGSTPRSLYSLLAQNRSLPWDKIYFFFGDERHVPPDSPESNYRMVRESLLSKVPSPAANVFRIPAENPEASEAAKAYEQTLRQFFNMPAKEFPRFDLVLLGMGPDGHTASLFPGTSALQEGSRWVVSNWVDKFKTDRITLTLPVLNNAAVVMFLVSGQDKASPLKHVIEGKESGELYPSKLIQLVDGELIWMVDRAAAAQLAPAA